MSSPAVLSIRDLTIRYGTAVAVDGLSLEVRTGEVYGLLGPNGSGKSSTLAAVAGTLRPASGSIHILGRPAGEQRHFLGIVPQELALYEELTARDNLTLFARLYGLRGKDLARRVDEALELVQLTERASTRVRCLSGGMQRRLNLACALPHRPALLLLDEPTVGVDVAARDAIFDSLRELRGRGCAIVFSTHQLHEAEALCDRVGLMRHGRLVAEGTLDELDAGLEEVYRRLTARSAAEP